MCRTAAQECPCGEACTYAVASATVFAQNAGVLCQNRLAGALRAVILSGPSKTTRIPMLVGPTNSGKTTLVKPFDLLFGFENVFHKPALGSKFALRNMLKDKRFLFWDDYRPVEYAQETIPVSTFLSLGQGEPFEVQVAQSFHDGNVDFEWRHGAVLTAKESGLWAPWGVVNEEDIMHLQSRVDVHRVVAKVPGMKDTTPCAVHMCRWVRDGAMAQDASLLLSPALPVQPGAIGRAASAHDGGPDVQGLEAVCQAAVPRISAHSYAALRGELLALGVIHVAELSLEDWASVRALSALLPFEQRRCMQALR